MYKLAILTSHPIQYQAPLFRKIAASGIDLIVCFKNRDSAEGSTYDKGFGREIQWDVPLLKGYRSVFITGLNDFSNILESFSPQALMVYGWSGTFNKSALFVAKKKKIPILIYGETPLLQERLKRGPLQILKRYFLRSFFKKIAAALYIGAENRKFYEFMGLPKKKLFFTPYAVENDRFVKAAEDLKNKRQGLREKLGVAKDDTAILFVGKLTSKKRPLDLLKAFELLKTKHQITNAPLIFVGDGVLRSELERYAKEKSLKNVHFAGFKNQTELPEYYAAADILVLPSGVGETWGLVVNEAMCFDLPIILSDIVGCGPDLLRSGKNGYFFPLGNINSLAEKMKLMAEAVKNKKFKGQSLKIIKDYNFERDVEGLSGALKSLTSKQLT